MSLLTRALDWLVDVYDPEGEESDTEELEAYR